MLSTAKNDIEIPRQARNDTFDCFVKNVNNAVNSYNLNVFLHTTVNNHTTIIALKKLENLLKLSYQAYSMLFKAFFKGVRRPQKRLLVKPFGRELSADRKRLATRLALAPASLAESRRARQALLDSPHRKRNCRNTSQIRRHRINIGEIHLERIIALFTEAEGWLRSGRRENQVYLFEGFFKIFPDERPHFLGLEIIRVVIPGGKRVRPQHNTPLDFRTKPDPPRIKICLQKAVRMSESIFDIIDAHAIFDP